MIAKTLSRIGVEVWKDIPEYEGLYQVSNLGNVRSLKHNKVKLIKTPLDNCGRAVTSLRLNNKTNTHRVHILVAKAFLKHKSCGMKIVVDHINNDKENNKLYNLQLITQRLNASKDRKGTSKYTGVFFSKSNGKYISSIRLNGKSKHLGYFVNEKEAAQAYINELNKII
tara:strand:- start:43 stop:549 length:507 start_codon:yes stop_codon:yes gene_type:complete